jgi:hypothetical protein
MTDNGQAIGEPPLHVTVVEKAGALSSQGGGRGPVLYKRRRGLPALGLQPAIDLAHQPGERVAVRANGNQQRWLGSQQRPDELGPRIKSQLIRPLHQHQPSERPAQLAGECR